MADGFGLMEIAIEFEGDHRAVGGIELLLSEGVLRVAWQARVEDTSDARVFFEPVGDGESGLGLFTDSQFEGFDATAEEEGFEGAEDGSGGVLDKVELVEEVAGAGDEGTGEAIAVSTQVFSGGMHDEVGTELEGAAEDGGGESIIDCEEDVVLFCDLGDAGDIGDGHEWIPDAFDPDHFGIGSDGMLDRIEVGGGLEGDIDTGSVADAVEEAVGAAVDIASGEEVITLSEVHHRAVGGGHTGGVGQATSA